MNYIQYINGDDANGDGMRCTLFVSGCELACKGCHNPESWNYKNGKTYTQDFENKIINDLKSPFIKGLTFSGGNPLHKRNIETVLSLCKSVKNSLPEKDIWLWSGYTLLEIQSSSKLSPILSTIDYLVDGRFVEELKCSGRFFGSSNQRIYHISDCGESIVDVTDLM